MSGYLGDEEFYKDLREEYVRNRADFVDDEEEEEEGEDDE